MSGPQFVHIETYARSVSSLRRKREVARAEKNKAVDRKLTVEEICGEAARLPGHFPHIAEAKPPVLLHGISPDEVPALLEEKIAEANAAIKAEKKAMARGTRKAGPRAIRSDTHVLLTMVASHPIPWCDPKTGDAPFDDPDNLALLEKWQSLNIEWAKAEAEAQGFELVSVVRHDDETYPHLHFIGIPKNERMEARGCHPGYIARDALVRTEDESDKEFRGRRDRAYKKEMRAFQDNYYDAVSIDAGLARTGPKRRRVPAAVWHEEKSAARARGLANARVDQLAAETKQKEQKLAEARDVLVVAQGDAVQAVVNTADLEAKRDLTERDLVAKETEAVAFNELTRDREVLLRQMEAENAALAKVETARRDLEEWIARTQAELSRAAAESERRTRELAELASQWLKEKKQEEAELARKRRALSVAQSEIDALTDGIAAYAEGKLRYVPENSAQPFVITLKHDGSDDELKNALIKVKPRLLPIIERIDNALSKRVTKLEQVLTKAVESWSAGVLLGVGKSDESGRPILIVADTADGKRLLKTLAPFRKAIAQVISALPDRTIVASVKKALSKLRLRLGAAEQEEARMLEINLERLHQKRTSERE